MRSKDFVSAFFYCNNFWKLLIAIAVVGAIVVKAVRDARKAKKQEEELRSALDDFYEEELNWWDREHEEGEEL